MAEAAAGDDVIKELIKKPFSSRTFQEKLDIVRRGRPTPKFDLSQPGKSFVRHFKYTNYERYPWITASETQGKLYCWECLLFSTDKLGAWSHTGFSNLNCLTKSAGKHQSTARHLQATVLLKTFGDTQINLQLSDQVHEETELHNEKVKKNREILKSLIDCIMFLGKQELPFRDHDECTESTNRGNYLELFNFLSEHNKYLYFHLTTNKAFTETSSKIQNDLINAVSQVLEDTIKREVKNAPFVAVMVDEITDIANCAQLSLVLRYVTEGGVKERFVRFEDVSISKKLGDISDLVIRFMEEFDCVDKVVAQCYDGAPVMSSGQNGVQAKVKEKAPMALFIHCYAHRLNLVLSQCVSKLKECKIFFAHLNGLAAFFSRSTKQTQLLDICQSHLPRVAPTRWQYATRLVSTVLEERDSLKKLFTKILEIPNDFDNESVCCADGYISRLDDFKFNFLLQVFNGIFENSDVIFQIFQNRSLDVDFCQQRVTEFCKKIEEKKTKFEQTFETTKNMSISFTNRRGSEPNERREHYRQLYENILNNILCQLHDRYKDHEKLKFLSLLDPDHFKLYSKTFPNEAFSSLSESHGNLFDMACLKTELTVMYAMIDFEGKTPADLIQFLQRKQLTNSMVQLFKLACLAVTLPVSTASVERTFSALKRIKTYSRNTMGQTRLSSLASISIEKQLLQNLKVSGVLHDRIIDVFLKKDRHMDFVFK